MDELFGQWDILEAALKFENPFPFRQWTSETVDIYTVIVMYSADESDHME